MSTLLRCTSFALAAFLLAATCGIGPALAAATTTQLAQVDQSTSTVTGVATDAAGAPVADVTITLSGPRSYSTQTGPDGSYTLKRVVPGAYAITATKAGYDTAVQSNVILTGGQSSNYSVALTQPTLTSIQTIGRTSTTVNRSRFNTTAAAVASIPRDVFTNQGQEQVQRVLDQTPGIVIDHPGTSANNASPGAITFPSIRGGLGFETSSLIDGHALAVGSFGDYVTTFLNPDVLQNVEVVKGPGAGLTQINYALNGAVNFRTLDVPTTQVAQIKYGFDAFGGHFSNFRYGNSFLDNKIQIILDYAVNGTPGPINRQPNYLFLPTSGSSYIVTANGTTFGNPNTNKTLPGTQNSIAGYSTTALAFGYPISETFDNKNELAKLRVNFSSATSVTLSYLGSQTYTDQNGNHVYGFNTVFSPGAAFTGAIGPDGQLLQPGASIATWQNLGGSGQLVPSYYEINNEPIFQGELRTSLGNNTILARAYAAAIQRLQYGGETGYSSPQSITLPVYGTFTPTGGVAQLYTGQPVTFTYSPNPNNGACGSLATGLTASGSVSNGGAVCGTAANPYTGYISQTFNPADEEDHINGETFEFDHPFGANLSNTASVVYDQIISNTLNRDFPGSFQAPGIAPGSNEIYRTFLGRVQLQLGSRVNLVLANYLNFHTYHYTTNQSVLAGGTCPAVPVAGAPACQAGVEFVSNPNPSFSQTQLWHDDPRGSITVRASDDSSVRLSAGSSIVPPYINLLSRTQGTYSQVGTPATAYTNTIPNYNIKPETAFSYDLGLDQRLFNRQAVLSFDAYYTNLFNQFYNFNQLNGCYNGTANAAAGANGTCPNGFVPVLSQQYVNLSNARYEGLEFALNSDPQVGWGYKLQGALQRAYVYNLPTCFYATNITCSNFGTNLNVIVGRNFTGTAPGLGGTNGVDNHSIPYSQGYGELHYRSAGGLYISGGLQYYGPNNSLYAPAFVTGNASFHFPLPIPKTHSTINAAVYNLSGVANKPYIQEYQGQPYSLINGNNALTSLNPLGPISANLWLEFNL